MVCDICEGQQEKEKPFLFSSCLPGEVGVVEGQERAKEVVVDGELSWTMWMSRKQLQERRRSWAGEPARLNPLSSFYIILGENI